VTVKATSIFANMATEYRIGLFESVTTSGVMTILFLDVYGIAADFSRDDDPHPCISE
jgi:hypothetical protein